MSDTNRHYVEARGNAMIGDKSAPNKSAPKFRAITEMPRPKSKVDISPAQEERAYGEAVLREWVHVARWYWPDEDVVNQLELMASHLDRRAR